MFNVWQSVKVTNEENPRFNTAGTVFATNQADHPTEVVVKFDVDGTAESVAIADLKPL